MRPGDLVLARPFPPHPSHPHGLPGFIVLIGDLPIPPAPRWSLPRRYFEVMTSIGTKTFYENEVSPLFPESSTIEASQ